MTGPASVLVKGTGEILEYPLSSPEEIMASYRQVNAQLEALEKLKKLIQDAAAEIVDEKGLYEHDGYLLRVTAVQRMNYDKASLREVFDPDELDLFLEPAKGKIDKYIKDHPEDLGSLSTQLRQAMVPTGRPYRVVRIERTK